MVEVLAYLSNTNHLCEYGFFVLEELCMKADLMVQTLSHISYEVVRICYYIVFLVLLKLLLGSLHVCESLSSLNEADKHNLFIDLRVNFHQKFDLGQVTLSVCTKGLPLNLYDSRFCCFKVPLYQFIMFFSNRKGYN
jgi:cytochrome c oxidase subunit IV